MPTLEQSQPVVDAVGAAWKPILAQLGPGYLSQAMCEALTAAFNMANTVTPGLVNPLDGDPKIGVGGN